MSSTESSSESESKASAVYHNFEAHSFEELLINHKFAVVHCVLLSADVHACMHVCRNRPRREGVHPRKQRQSPEGMEERRIMMRRETKLRKRQQTRRQNERRRRRRRRRRKGRRQKRNVKRTRKRHRRTRRRQKRKRRKTSSNRRLPKLTRRDKCANAMLMFYQTLIIKGSFKNSRTISKAELNSKTKH